MYININCDNYTTIFQKKKKKQVMLEANAPKKQITFIYLAQTA